MSVMLEVAIFTILLPTVVITSLMSVVSAVVISSVTLVVEIVTSPVTPVADVLASSMLVVAEVETSPVSLTVEVSISSGSTKAVVTSAFETVVASASTVTLQFQDEGQHLPSSGIGRHNLNWSGVVHSLLAQIISPSKH